MSVDERAALPSQAATPGKQGGAVGPKSEDLGDRLLVQHKLTSDNLRNADKMGGLPMPSIAVGRVDTPIEGYGEITLIGDKSMAKPSARNPVYSSDAYSPTYPTIDYKYDWDTIQDLNNRLADVAKKVQASDIYPESLEYGERSLRDQPAVMGKFLQDQGENIDYSPNLKPWEITTSMRYKIDKVGRADYDNYVADLHASLNPQERLFAGWTPSGNRRYRPHTLDEVVKRMKQDMKDTNQTNMFGSGALRAQVAPRFRNITDIKQSRGRIKPAEDLDVMKEELNERLSDISHKFDEYSTYKDSNPFIAGDVNRDRLLDITQGHATYDEYFPGAPKEIIDEWESYLSDLKNAPTAYFEGKPQRAVGLDEFVGALVPEDAPDDVIEILRRNGITQIERYTDDASRAEKMKAFKNLLFQSAPVAVGVEAWLESEPETGIELGLSQGRSMQSIVNAYKHHPDGEESGRALLMEDAKRLTPEQRKRILETNL